MSQPDADIERLGLNDQLIDTQVSESSIAQAASDLPAEGASDSAPNSAADGASGSSPEGDNDSDTATVPEWMTQEIKLIGWFDPDYSGPSNSTGYTVAADRQYIYYDVFAFTARVQTRLNTSGTEQKAKAVLPNCLCNAARIWYNDMSDHERDLLKNSKISYWYEVIEARFASTGEKLASAPASPTKLYGHRKGKKGKSENVGFWDRRRGETHDEHQGRMRRGGTGPSFR